MWPFDQNNQWMYQQYAQAYNTGNYSGLNHNQMLEQLMGFLRGAPPQMQQQVYQQHFSQMPYEQRALIAQQMPFQYGVNPNDPWSMSQGFLRMGQEQPHLIRQIFSHPLLIGGALGLAGLAAHHILTHHQIAYNNQPYNIPSYDYNQNQWNNPGGFQQNSFQDPYNSGGFSNQGFQPNPYDQLADQQQEINELRSELREEERERDYNNQEW